MKLCIECKHYNDGLCNSLKIRRNRVDGSPKNKYCSTNRLDPWPFHYIFGSCGVHGRFWEKKDDISNENVDNKLGTDNDNTKERNKRGGIKV